MQVFRIKINPGGTASQDDTFQYCLDNKLLGVGWRIQPNQLRATKNWDDYETKAVPEYYGDIKKAKYIRERVRKNDLV